MQNSVRQARMPTPAATESPIDGRRREEEDGREEGREGVMEVRKGKGWSEWKGWRTKSVGTKEILGRTGKVGKRERWKAGNIGEKKGRKEGR